MQAILGSFGDMSVLAIVVAVVQFVMMFLQTEMGQKYIPNVSPRTKLLIVSGLSIVGAVAGQMLSSGQGLLPALTSGTVLAALQVFVNQIIKKSVAA